MIKLFEEFKFDYLYKLFINSIIEDKIIINGYVCSYDNMAGIIEWGNDTNEFTVYATPYYNEYDELPITVCDNDDEDVFNTVIKLKELKNMEDVEIVKKFYYDTMKHYLTRLPEIISASKYNI
jgi:hypothetical protein